MKNHNELEHLLLETLSFFEVMRFEQLVFDIDESKLSTMNELRRDQVEQALESLVRRKIVKKIKIDGEDGWQKVFPKKKNWIMKIFF